MGGHGSEQMQSRRSRYESCAASLPDIAHGYIFWCESRYLCGVGAAQGELLEQKLTYVCLPLANRANGTSGALSRFLAATL